MFKTGITDINKLLGEKSKTFLLKEFKNTTITLYDQILNESNAEELSEKVLVFFSDERGAYKRTYNNRFNKFDDAAIDLIKTFFSSENILTVQDMGVSDGRTSCDFFEKIVQFFPLIAFYASDYNGYVLVLEKGKTKITLSHRENLLEVLFPPFVFNIAKRDSYRYYPINHLVRLMHHWLVVNPLLKEYKNGNHRARKLLLFSPRAINLSKTDQRFKLLQHDLLMPFHKQSHIIRAMNVLNPSYFSETEFTKVLSNIYNGLYLGSFLITGSNQDAGSDVDGGIYKKNKLGFEKIWQADRPSPINDKILGFKKEIYS